MLMTIKSSFESVPAGNYKATFTGLTTIETQKGKAFRWAFETIDTKKAISGLSDAERGPTVKNKTGRWLAALSNKSLAEGVSVDPDNYVGKRYLVIVDADGKMVTFSATN